MEVECIENDECILDTVNIHVKKMGLFLYLAYYVGGILQKTKKKEN